MKHVTSIVRFVGTMFRARKRNGRSLGQRSHCRIRAVGEKLSFRRIPTWPLAILVLSCAVPPVCSFGHEPSREQLLEEWRAVEAIYSAAMETMKEQASRLEELRKQNFLAKEKIKMLATRIRQTCENVIISQDILQAFPAEPDEEAFLTAFRDRAREYDLTVTGDKPQITEHEYGRQAMFTLVIVGPAERITAFLDEHKHDRFMVRHDMETVTDGIRLRFSLFSITPANSVEQSVTESLEQHIERYKRESDAFRDRLGKSRLTAEERDKMVYVILRNTENLSKNRYLVKKLTASVDQLPFLERVIAVLRQNDCENTTVIAGNGEADMIGLVNEGVKESRIPKRSLLSRTAFGKTDHVFIEPEKLGLDSRHKVPLPLVMTDWDATSQVRLDVAMLLDGLDWALNAEPFREHCSYFSRLRRGMFKSLLEDKVSELATKARKVVPIGKTELSCPGCLQPLKSYAEITLRELAPFKRIQERNRDDDFLLFNMVTHLLQGTFTSRDMRFCLFCPSCEKVFQPVIDELVLSRKPDGIPSSATISLWFDAMPAVEGTSATPSTVLSMMSQGRMLSAGIALHALRKTMPRDPVLLTCQAMFDEMHLQWDTAFNTYATVVDITDGSNDAYENLATFCVARRSLDYLGKLHRMNREKPSRFDPKTVRFSAQSDQEWFDWNWRWIGDETIFETYLKTNDYEKAFKLMGEYRDKPVSREHYLITTTVIFHFAGRFDESLKHCLRMVEEGFHWPKCGEYIEVARKAIHTRDKDLDRLEVTYQEHMTAMAEYYDNKDYEAAMTSIEKALSIFPESARALTEKANILHMTGRYDAAEKVYRQAISLNPADAYSLANYASFLSVTRTAPADLNTALRMAGRALMYDSDQVFYHEVHDRIAGILVGHFSSFGNDFVFEDD